MRRLLIVGCSETKDHTPGEIPALSRYTGAYFQMIKTATEPLPEIVILSAEYGFLRSHWPISDYSRRMDKACAAELLSDLAGATPLSIVLASEKYDEVLVAAGELYRTTINESLASLQARGTFKFDVVRSTRGGIGEQRSQLKAWLAGKN